MAGKPSSRSPEWTRICAAMVDVALERGYEETTIEAIVERAEVSRADFDRHFSGKQDCCLQTFADISDRLNVHLRAVEEAGRELSWRDRTRTVAYAALRYFRDHAREFEFGALELADAGDLALTRQAATLQEYVDLIDEGRQELDDPESLTRATAEVVVGSVFELLAKRLPETGFRDIESLVPGLMYIAVGPYCGNEAAREELTIPPPPELPVAGA